MLSVIKELKNNKSTGPSSIHSNTAWKVFICGVFSGPYFPIFSQSTGKYGPEKTSYLDTFHAVWISQMISNCTEQVYIINS